MSGGPVLTFTAKGAEPVTVQFPRDADPFVILDKMFKKYPPNGSSAASSKEVATSAALLPSAAEGLKSAPQVPGSSASTGEGSVQNGSAAQGSAPALEPRAQPRATPAVADRQDHPSGVRATSHAAYTKLRFSGQLAEKQREIYNHFAATPMRTWTRSELAEAMGLRMNSCTGRVAEMLDLGALEELPEKRKCRITGENVTQLRIKP